MPKQYCLGLFAKLLCNKDPLIKELKPQHFILTKSQRIVTQAIQLAGLRGTEVWQHDYSLEQIATYLIVTISFTK